MESRQIVFRIVSGFAVLGIMLLFLVNLSGAYSEDWRFYFLMTEFVKVFLLALIGVSICSLNGSRSD